MLAGTQDHTLRVREKGDCAWVVGQQSAPGSVDPFDTQPISIPTVDQQTARKICVCGVTSKQRGRLPQRPEPAPQGNVLARQKLKNMVSSDIVQTLVLSGALKLLLFQS